MALAVSASALAALPATRADDGARIIAVADRGPRLRDLTIASPTLGRTAMVRLLLPRRFEAEPARRWPAPWLLHGCCDSYQSWTRSTNVQQLPALADVLGDHARGRRGRVLHRLARRRPRRAGPLGDLPPGRGPPAAGAQLPCRRQAGGGRGGRPAFGRRTTPPTSRPGCGIALFVSVGNGQPGPLNAGVPAQQARRIERALEPQTLAFVGRLRKLGVPVQIDAYGPGVHDWLYWQRELHRSLPLLQRALDAGGGCRSAARRHPSPRGRARRGGGAGAHPSER